MNAIEPRIYQIVVTHREELETALSSLVRRAKRIGVPPFSYAWGTPYVVQVRCSKDRPDASPSLDEHGRTLYHRFITKIPLALTGEGPCLKGWAFRATLQHLDGENILRATPVAETAAAIPRIYRTRGPVCDHCKLDRRRVDTLLLEHENGHWLQIGRNCLVDFLGDDRAALAASLAEILSSATSLANDASDEEYEGGRSGKSGRGCEALVHYLGYAATAVRVWGWLSASAAEKMDSAGIMSTRARIDNARFNLFCREEDKLPLRTVEDTTRALAVCAWAEGITDAEVERNDYMHNLRAIARSGVVDSRTYGLACSMIAAFDKAVGRETERAARAAAGAVSTYFGTIGKREVFTLTITGHSSWENAYGMTHLYRFVDTAGNIAIWRASSCIVELEVGGTFEIKGTVKTHGEWRGSDGKGRPVLQTTLTRCTVIRTVMAAPSSAPHDAGTTDAVKVGS